MESIDSGTNYFYVFNNWFQYKDFSRKRIFFLKVLFYPCIYHMCHNHLVKSPLSLSSFSDVLVYLLKYQLKAESCLQTTHLLFASSQDFPHSFMIVVALVGCATENHRGSVNCIFFDNVCSWKKFNGIMKVDIENIYSEYYLFLQLLP